MKELKPLLKYFNRYKWMLLAGLCCVILQRILMVYPAKFLRETFNEVSAVLKIHTFSQHETYSIVVPNLLKYLAFYIAGAIFMFLMRQAIIVISRRMEFDQRNDIYNHYQSLDTNFYKRNRTGDLMARLTEDVSRVRNLTGPALMYSTNLLITFVFVIYMMFHVSAELAIFTLLPLPVLSLSVYFVNQIINRRSTKIQSQLSALTTVSQETFSGIRVIQSFVQEKSVQQHFEKEAGEYKNLSLSLAKVEAIYFPFVAFLIGLSTIIVIWKGGILVGEGKISVGNIAEFVLYVTMLVFPVTSLGWVASIIQRAIVSQKRINEFLKEQPAIASNANAYQANMKGEIEFKNVSLVYENTGLQALKNLSFKINAGERIAIVGKNGIGKTSIAQLITRMLDATEGEILIDGINLKNWNLKSLRNQIGYVPQDVFLFSDSVKANILFGTDEKKSDEAISRFAKAAVIDSEINRLENGYETVIGERGVTLSGGQKQRISIARALIKQPKILLLDDCLSAVDNNTEAALMNNFQELFKDKTVINITHRLAHLSMYDKVFELTDNGLIVK